MLTLRRPTQLLLCIRTGHRRRDLEPHCTASIPALHILTRWYLRQIVLCGSRVVDLLGADVVDGCTSRNGCYGRRIGRRVTPDISRGGILDALLRFGVLRLPGR